MRSLQSKNLLEESGVSRPRGPPYNKPSSIAHPNPGLSLPATAPFDPNITVFLRNLRLLNLDVKDDWPFPNADCFSSKGLQQNPRDRIRCIEWALYHLFEIWDPEETRSVSHDSSTTLLKLNLSDKHCWSLEIPSPVPCTPAFTVDQPTRSILS